MTLTGHLNTLESTGLIRLARVEPELEYLFRHALVQEAVYATLLKADQKRLHREVGEALERAYPDRLDSRELAPVLGRHFAQAGETGRALAYFIRAAEQATTSYANQEAEAHYRAALALANTDAERSSLLVGLGRVLSRQSRHREAIDAWREAIGVCLALKDVDRAAWLYARSARSLWYLSEVPASLVLCDEGLAAVGEEQETAGLAALIHETARACYFNGRQERAVALCRRALDMAGRLGAVDVQADALTTLAILPDLPGEEVVAALNKAVELAESAGLWRIAIRAHHNLGNASRFYLFDAEAARRHYQRAAELARQRGSISEELLSSVNAVYWSLSRGDLADVDAALPGLRQLMGALPDPGPAGVSIDTLEARLHTSRGRWAEAHEILMRCQAQARQWGHLDVLQGIDTAIIYNLDEMAAWGEAIDWQAAEETAREATSLVDRGLGGDRIEARTMLASLYLTSGRVDEARALVADAERVASEGGPEWQTGPLNWIKGRLAAAEGRWSEAAAHYEAVVQLVERISARWERARIMIEWASILARRGGPGDRERGRVLLREAQEAFARMGAARYVELIEPRLQALSAEVYDELLDRHKAAQELATAGQIQTAFLPEALPALPGWQLAVRWEPARQTSGDFYDAIPLPGGRLGLLIADVSDKGAAAALYMAMSRTVIRTYAEQAAQPEAAVAAANRRILADSHADMFVTAFYGILDPATGTFTYCNAGHNPPLLFCGGEPDRPPHALVRTGMALGVMAEATWEQGTIQIEPGDMLLLYTDGVIDAQNRQGSFFGQARLLEAARAGLGSAAQALQESLIAAVHAFVAGAPRADDITIMVVARERPD